MQPEKKYMRFKQSLSSPEDGDPVWVHHLFWHGGKGKAPRDAPSLLGITPRSYPDLPRVPMGVPRQGES